MNPTRIPFIPYLPEETRPEYLLRVAAAYIMTHCPQDQVSFENIEDPPATGEELALELISEAGDLAKERAKESTGIEFIGNITEAGNDPKGQPRVTISTSAEQLRICGPIPFYLAANITIAPINR